jgi:hypothetical protein
VKGQVRGLGLNLQSQLSSLAELWLTAHGLDMLDPRVKTNTAPEQKPTPPQSSPQSKATIAHPNQFLRTHVALQF